MGICPVLSAAVFPRLGLRDCGLTHLDQLAGFGRILLDGVLQELCLKVAHFVGVLAMQDRMLSFHVLFHPLGQKAENFAVEIAEEFQPCQRP